MYEFDNAKLATARGKVPPVVIWMGIVSMLTDMSAEMVACILPYYLVMTLQFSPMQFGMVEALQHLVMIAARVFAAYWADRWQSIRSVALFGYALSCGSRLVWLAAQNAMLFSFVATALDRIGKGIRTAPRDSLIAAHVQPSQLTTALGVHRRLDALGAMAGPLLAALFLWLMPEFLKNLFYVSFVCGLLAILVMSMRVPSQTQSLTQHTALNDQQRSELFKHFWAYCNSHQRLILAGISTLFLLSLFSVSESVVYLLLIQRMHQSMPEMSMWGAYWMPLLFAATAFVFVLSATLIARLADRVGVSRILLAGFAILIPLYGMLAYWIALPVAAIQTWMAIAVIPIALGLHYAMTDGILAGLVLKFAPARFRTLALACVLCCMGLAKAASSLIFSFFWQTLGATQALAIMAFGLVLVLVFTSFAMRRKIKHI